MCKIAAGLVESRVLQILRFCQRILLKVLAIGMHQNVRFRQIICQRFHWTIDFISLYVSAINHQQLRKICKC